MRCRGVWEGAIDERRDEEAEAVAVAVAEAEATREPERETGAETWWDVRGCRCRSRWGRSTPDSEEGEVAWLVRGVEVTVESE